MGESGKWFHVVHGPTEDRSNGEPFVEDVDVFGCADGKVEVRCGVKREGGG